VLTTALRHYPRVRPLPIALSLVCVASSAMAAQPPERSISYTNLTAGRVNPLGLIEVFELGYRLRLYDSTNPLFENNFVSFALRPALTPAWGRLSGVLRIQPLSILQLWAEYGAGGHFGTFGLMQSFPTATADVSDTALDAREEAGVNYAATGTQIGLGVLLQAKVGPIAARSSARFIRPNHDLQDGDTAYYNIVYDIVIPDRAWAVNKDTDLLWVSKFGLVAGVRWSLTHAFTRETDFSPDEAGRNAPLHRVGPLLAYSFWDEPGAAFNKPTALVVANWWLQHPSRTGQDSSQAIPYLILGFTCEGDLWQAN
jgi:hypothetical protein